jgi:competence protein ComEA
MYVDVAGAVTTPGVHKVEKSARAGAAVAAAGGLTTQANQLFLRKYFNAAAPLTDGQKMYIPFENEEISDLNTASSTSREEESVISINSATVKELDTLPGIGTVRAEEIVAGRPYSRLEELQERNIVTTSVYEGLAGLIKL